MNRESMQKPNLAQSLCDQSDFKQQTSDETGNNNVREEDLLELRKKYSKNTTTNILYSGKNSFRNNILQNNEDDMLANRANNTSKNL